VLHDSADTSRLILMHFALSFRTPQLTHNIAPHLSLSPDDMTAHLSRLLMALRDATQSALHDTENGVKLLIEESAAQSDARIKELEESLVHMQQELDAARMDNEAKEKTLQIREADVQLELTALGREVKTLRHEGKEAKQMEEAEKKRKLVNVETEEHSRKRTASENLWLSSNQLFPIS
jgi:hypothetical protein